MGHTFEQVAALIGKMGRGELPGRPSETQFPVDYRISRQAVGKAMYKALYRAPNQAAEKYRQEGERFKREAEEFRRLAIERYEQAYLNLQPGIQRGNVRSLAAAIRITNAKNKLPGF